MSEVLFDGVNKINKVIEVNKMNNKQGVMIAGTFEGAIKFKVSTDNGKHWVPEMQNDEDELRVTSPRYLTLNQRHCWLSIDLSECTDYSNLYVEVE